MIKIAVSSAYLPKFGVAGSRERNQRAKLTSAIPGKRKSGLGQKVAKPLWYWWPPRESNTAPTDYESAALTKHELGGQKISRRF